MQKKWVFYIKLNAKDKLECMLQKISKQPLIVIVIAYENVQIMTN
jgi:hypothetical protein